MKEKHIKEIIVDQIELSDLDLVVQDELLGNNPDGHDCTWERDGNGWSWEEHLSIANLEGVIKALKSKGATHIQIESNGDHHSYTFMGTKLEVLSEKEIKEKERLKLEQAIKSTERSVQGLENNCEETKEHLQKLKKQLTNLK